MRYAILDADNHVENLIEADEAFVAANFSRWVKAESWCGVGAAYDPETETFKPAE